MSDEVSVLDNSAMNIVLIIRNALFSLPTYAKLNADTDEKKCRKCPSNSGNAFPKFSISKLSGGHVPGKLEGA